MILVNGASGKTGKAIIRSLVNMGQPVKAFIRRDGQRAAMTALGVSEIFIGDMTKAEDFKIATKGTEKIYHICPNVSEYEVEIGKNMIYAAQNAGIERVIYHSVLHPHIEAMPHHWLKMRVEEMIIQSGLSFTILQPTAYMQNILNLIRVIKETGTYQVPFEPHSNTSLVDLLDVAEIATKVLIDPGHFGASYELVGIGKINPAEIANELASKMSTQIRAEKIDLLAWKENSKKSGMSKYSIDSLLKMFQYYEEFNLRGNDKVLGFLLGRKPTTFSTFLERELSRSNK